MSKHDKSEIQENSSEKPTEQTEWLGAMTEAMIADAMHHHPCLTREEALEDLRAAGAC